MVLIMVDQICCETKASFSMGFIILYRIFSDSTAVQPALLR